MRCGDCGSQILASDVKVCPYCGSKNLTSGKTSDEIEKLFDIEKYSGGRFSSLMVDRLFADVLCQHPNMERLKPHKVDHKSKFRITASDVAGVLSLAVLGIGWIRTGSSAVSIVEFDSGPVAFAIINNGDIAQVSFFSQVKSTFSREKDGLLAQICLIRQRASNCYVELESKHSAQITDCLRKDEKICGYLNWLYSTGIAVNEGFPHHFGYINLDFYQQKLFAVTHLKLTNNKKNWIKRTKESSNQADNFVLQLFHIGSSISERLQKLTISRDIIT